MFTTLGCKDFTIIRSEFVAETQFLYLLNHILLFNIFLAFYFQILTFYFCFFKLYSIKRVGVDRFSNFHPVFAM